MTTITIERKLLEQAVDKLLTCWPKSDPLVNELRAALAAPATAPERKPMDKEHQDGIVDAAQASQWSFRRNVRWVIEATERHHGVTGDKP